jgi:hypothetical protein
MKIRLLILVASAVGGVAFSAACGSSGGTGGGSTGNGMGGSTGAGMGGSSGAGMCAASCADAITNGGEPCSSDTAGASAYSTLNSCLSTSCANECSTYLSGHTALDADTTCPTCSTTNCKSDADACNNN